jgi:hypothetical protein
MCFPIVSFDQVREVLLENIMKGKQIRKQTWRGGSLDIFVDVKIRTLFFSFHLRDYTLS